MAWLQLFVTEHVDYIDRARKGDVTACVDFTKTLGAHKRKEQKKPVDDNRQY